MAEPKQSQPNVDEVTPEVELSNRLTELDKLADILARREAAMNKAWANAVTNDEECGRLMNQVQDKLFQLHSQRQATAPVGRINVTEYVNKAHLFPANSLGSDAATVDDKDLKIIYHKVARCTHPDTAIDKTDDEDFKLARSLYKARDFEGLCLLYVRVAAPDASFVVTHEQLLEFASNRVSVIKKQMSTQENSIGFAALAEIQRGVNPIPKVRSMLTQWHARLDAM